MKAQVFPELPPKFIYRLDLRHHVTPRLMREEPIHRWFVFPHSYSPQLVGEVIKEYPLPNGAALLDPFVGAGTTVLWAKQNDFSATGTDLSPLSVFVSQTKLASYNSAELLTALRCVLDYKSDSDNLKQYPERIRRAFSRSELMNIESLRRRIQELPTPLSPFFILALLNVQQKLSRAVPDGGWFRWVEKEDQSSQIALLFMKQIEKQISDITGQSTQQIGNWSAYLLDARRLNTIDGIFDALITSPPYPNRHDYSRIFHMELLSLGESEEDIFRFRHASIRSHVEARVPDLQVSGYSIPPKLEQTLNLLPENADPRVAPMLKGYFEDMYYCLKSAYMRLKPKAPCAFVVGNVRHAGVMVPVDEILVEVGEQTGFAFDCGWVARLRGNSAQQMAIYGREPSRETIVIFTRQ